jgi:hypothetical protein
MTRYLVKIRFSETFIGSDLKPCERSDAPLESKEIATIRAIDKFGQSWQKYADLVPATKSDWARYAGSHPKRMTYANRRRLDKLHSRFPMKRWKWVDSGKEYLVFARAAQKAELLLKEVGVTVNWRTFMRHAQTLRQFPFSTKNAEPGVWIQNGSQWKKIV